MAKCINLFLIWVTLFLTITKAVGETIQIGDESFDYDPDLFNKPVDPKKTINPSAIIETANSYIAIISNSTVMGSLETVLRESYKFIRLADDLHEIKSYLNDIRLCFIALTISGYVGIIFYALVMCITKRRRDTANPRRPISRSDEEMGMGQWKSDEGYQNTPSNRTPDYRYTRNQNRHFQTALQSKLDSVDTPTKQQLIVENHTGTSVPVTGVIRENGGPGVVDRISAN